MQYKEYPVEVRHNTIDTEIFRPTAGNFRERFNLSGSEAGTEKSTSRKYYCDSENE